MLRRPIVLYTTTTVAVAVAAILYEHITSVVEDLHWLPVSQQVVFKTALMVWKCVRGVAPAYLSDLCVPAIMHCHLRSSASAICSDWHSVGSTRPDCNWTTKFRSQRTSHMEPSATSSTVIGPVGQTGPD